MTQTIQYGSNFSVSNAFVPDIYEIVVPPTAYFGGTPTSVGAVTGTASWGQKNYPTLIGSPAQIVSSFGGITANSPNNVHDLCTDLTQAINQVSTSSGIMLYGIRVSDGTDLQAQATVYNGTSEVLTFTGTLTTGDVINLLFTNTNLPNGSYNLKYTVVSGDSTLTLLATHITSAITASTTLANAGFSATSSSAAITISWATTQGGVSIATAINGTTTVTVGGSITASDILTINVLDANLPGGTYSVPYTVQGGDSTTTIATAFKNLINANTNLSSIGVTATSSAAVLSITSTDTLLTTYTKTLSAGATETLTIAAGPTEVATITPPSAGMTIKARYTGQAGNAIAVSIQPGAATGTLTMIVSPFPGGGSNEIFANLPGGASTFWTAAQNAVNLGLNSTRGPSNFITITGATPTTSAPVTGTYTLAGGTDGHLVTTAQLVGTQAPATGIYTLVTPNVQFPPSVLWCAGLTDSTAYAAINTFCQQNNIFSLFTFASGTSVAAAVSAKQGYGIANYQSGFILGWVYWFDQVNQIARLTPPLATAAGAICTLPPWASPLNSSVLNVLGTEQNNPYTGNTPYAYSDLNSLGQAGIMTLTNPIPGGNVFGFRNGFNSIGNNQPNGTVEYSRLTNYIVVTNGQLLGPFLGKMQTLSSNDPTRAAVQTTLNSFFQSLLQSGYISAYNVICNTTNNTQLSIAMGELMINELITYNGTIMYILVDVNGGVTVVANANQSGSQLGS